MGLNVLALGASKKYTAETMEGAGAIKGDKGDDGFSPIADVVKAGDGVVFSVTDRRGTTTATLEASDGGFKPLRFEVADGIYHPDSAWNSNKKAFDSLGYHADTGIHDGYACIEYALKGNEKKIRFSGANGGGDGRCAYCFTDDQGNTITREPYVKGSLFRNVYVDVPEGATKVYINGNTAYAPHLEIGFFDEMADLHWNNQLMERIGKRISYNEKFAWKPMPHGLFAFTFDDSLAITGDIVDLFIRKNVPACFGAIPDRLGCVANNGQTIAENMQRLIDRVGGEVLSHGTANETVTDLNIDDKAFLYSKFVQNRQKLEDNGFTVRGVVRVGGTIYTDADGNIVPQGTSGAIAHPNICNDPRTDVWCKLFYDYGDLYGVAEPYNHPRVSHETEAEYKADIDRAIANKTFCPMLFHQPPAFLETLIDYVKSKGGEIVTYAEAYDKYGSTEKEMAIENRLTALEQGGGSSIPDGNGVEY